MLKVTYGDRYIVGIPESLGNDEIVRGDSYNTVTNLIAYYEDDLTFNRPRNIMHGCTVEYLE